MPNLTAEQLEKMAWDTLIIRACMEYKGPRARTVTIDLFTACRDSDTNKFFYRARYGYEEPMGPSGTGPSLQITRLASDDELRLHELNRHILNWQMFRIDWAVPEAAVAYEVRPGRGVRRIRAGDHILMQHYARLHTELCNAIDNEPEHRWFLPTMRDRLEAFLIQRTEEWSEVFAKMSNEAPWR